MWAGKRVQPWAGRRSWGDREAAGLVWNVTVVAGRPEVGRLRKVVAGNRGVVFGRHPAAVAGCGRVVGSRPGVVAVGRCLGVAGRRPGVAVGRCLGVVGRRPGVVAGRRLGGRAGQVDAGRLELVAADSHSGGRRIAGKRQGLLAAAIEHDRQKQRAHALGCRQSTVGQWKLANYKLPACPRASRHGFRWACPV